MTATPFDRCAGNFASGMAAMLALLSSMTSSMAGEIPETSQEFILNYCAHCHDADTREGGVNLESETTDWKNPESFDKWHRVFKVLQSGKMPPQDESQPEQDERGAMLSWLDDELTQHSPLGGTVARRLNRQEYLNSIKSLFGIEFELPNGFPADLEGHGFDNVGESLVLSPPLMEAYSDTANLVADQIFPPHRPSPSLSVQVPPEDMGIVYAAGSVRDGTMRLVAKTNSAQRSCTWPSTFEAPASGVYRVKIKLSAFRPTDDTPLLLEIRAKSVTGKDSAVDQLRLLKRIELSNQSPEEFEFEAEVYKGETTVFYYANAPLNGDEEKDEQFASFLRKKFSSDQRLLAAWMQVKHKFPYLRAGEGWLRLKEILAREDLDLSKADVDSPAAKAIISKMCKRSLMYAETIAYEHFETGPAVAIHGVSFEGPLRIIEDDEDRKRMRIQTALMGQLGKGNQQQYIDAMLERLLSAAYRRPATEQTIAPYSKMVSEHIAAGHSLEEGMHLAIRTALLSPLFLYRSVSPGPLDDWDLASRLSFFLTNAPPDEILLRSARHGKLSDPLELRRQAARLLEGKNSNAFVESFTGQWLDTRALKYIVPDQQFNFSDGDREDARKEVEMFFHEMIASNRPMTDFIDPDFTFTTASIAEKVYGITQGTTQGKKKSKSLERFPLERGGRVGGVLGMSAVMIATANGVDTSPVLRGVWVLENIIGSPPPPPPDSVPALTPDTTGATTPRELLALHALDKSCAGCHHKIDPVGFALENFDPVGRWRETYPLDTFDENGKLTIKDGPVIDASGVMPDGTELRDYLDLKKWLVANIDQFSECLADKLLIYATGRPMNYAEHKEVVNIVHRVQENGNGFRDLILALVDSDMFRTK